MYHWLGNIRWNKVLVASVIFTIISFLIHQLETVLTLKYYLMPEYFSIWSRLMMPQTGPPPISFMLTSILFSFLTGFVLAGFYDLIKDRLPVRRIYRIISFGDITFSLALVFFTLPTLLLFNLPFGLLFIWLVSTYLILIIAGAVFTRILGK